MSEIDSFPGSSTGSTSSAFAGSSTIVSAGVSSTGGWMISTLSGRIAPGGMILT